MTEITAPWTFEQVAALNHHQDAGAMHPFTCGNLHDDSRSPVLTATTDGWRCPNPTCDYQQDWAHAFMAATEESDPVEPDNPAAYALATHIADHPISTIQAAFRHLGWSLAFTATATEEPTR